ncbi:substrate-binding domain-containing protein [Tunturiibacter lichenicola]|jgi:ribose transport system substrate-binding protein|uniref:substrate-binding domain-containing protein n=1 Tax=Tunturiibacter lichenicola TaxID=2051959 RepID=UPI0021B33CEA|nr:substrate-binding domain-containing protein [Edaphobacter lichenicola]
MVSKRISFALLAVVLPLVSGCNRHSKSEQYYLIATNTAVPYWKAGAAGFEAAGTEYGVSVDTRGPAGLSPQAEVDEFKAMVARKPAGILVSVANSQLMTPEIDAAIAAGIPVVTIDSDAPESKRLFFIGTNNLEAGRLGGRRVAAQLNGKGNVVFFSNPGQPNLDERLKGYQDIFTAYPGIKVVEVFDIKADPGTALDQAGVYLARTGPARIDAFVCLDSRSGVNVAEAFKRRNATDRLLVAMDVDSDTLKLVGDGTIDSTISQKPYTMAFLGLKALDEIHHYPVKPLDADFALDPYSPFPAFVNTGVALVDKTNLDAVLKKQAAANK